MKAGWHNQLVNVCFELQKQTHFCISNVIILFIFFFIISLKIWCLFMQFCGCFDCFREGNEPGDELTVTYRELLQRVCQFANVLKSQGTLQLTSSTAALSALPVKHFPCFILIHAIILVSSCAPPVCRSEEGRPRVHLHAHGGGAGGSHVGLRPHRSRSLHRGESEMRCACMLKCGEFVVKDRCWSCVFCCVQFAGFSAESLCERILDSQCSLLITAGEKINLHRRFPQKRFGRPCGVQGMLKVSYINAVVTTGGW